MWLKETILEKHELISVWPGKNNAYKCIVLEKDNSKGKHDIPKAECELNMYLNLVKHKLRPEELAKIKDLIEAYGEERVTKEQEYQAELDAGEDL
jgi:hypothetical protein